MSSEYQYKVSEDGAISFIINGQAVCSFPSLTEGSQFIEFIAESLRKHRKLSLDLPVPHYSICFTQTWTPR